MAGATGRAPTGRAPWPAPSPIRRRPRRGAIPCAVMPTPRPSPRGPRDPLANLPRPLSERERRRGPGRLLGSVLLAGLIVTGIAIARPGFGAGDAGDVQGAVASPDPAAAPTASPLPVAVAESSAARPNATAAPIPTVAPPSTPAPPASLTGYEWPLPKGRLTLEFGPSPWGSRVVDGELFHDGIDLATFCGDRVVAAHAGTVLAAGRRYDALMGWVGDLQPYLDRLEKKQLYGTLPIVVIVDDGNGYRSVYAHFGKLKVKKGQVVKAGQLLGWEGATGRASGCHLHYGLFSPLETATFGIDKDVVKRMKLPDQQIARIDPLLVLPDRAKPTKKPQASTDPASTSAP
jgi:murein DD-endopeptidase MepM/ murein hydrolase activator NlpD